jgi:hypothetical protein
VPAHCILYRRIPYRRIPYRRIPHRRIPYRRTPYRRIPYRRIPYRRIPYRPIPYRRIPYRRIPYVLPLYHVQSGLDPAGVMLLCFLRRLHRFGTREAEKCLPQSAMCRIDSLFHESEFMKQTPTPSRPGVGVDRDSGGACHVMIFQAGPGFITDDDS